jgi:hypothetical protein
LANGDYLCDWGRLSPAGFPWLTLYLSCPWLPISSAAMLFIWRGHRAGGKRGATAVRVLLTVLLVAWAEVCVLHDTAFLMEAMQTGGTWQWWELPWSRMGETRLAWFVASAVLVATAAMWAAPHRRQERTEAQQRAGDGRRERRTVDG